MCIIFHLHSYKALEHKNSNYNTYNTAKLENIVKYNSSCNNGIKTE